MHPHEPDWLFYGFRDGDRAGCQADEQEDHEHQAVHVQRQTLAAERLFRAEDEFAFDYSA